ncbi:MAG: hypothetical protein P4L87_22095 [Formivibrio sp.]|nr:hypothetical protein [Formivibrio sp.]
MSMQQGGWQPLSTYDALEVKPRYAVFFFPAVQTEGCSLPEEIKTVREFASRECTLWHPIQAPSIIAAKEIPNAQTKKLTANQMTALSLLAKGKADFHATVKAGANLSTMSALVKSGLARTTQSSGVKQWEITDFGMTVLHATENAGSRSM